MEAGTNLGPRELGGISISIELGYSPTDCDDAVIFQYSALSSPE